MDRVLLKSPLGREAMRARTHGLDTLARRILILADGHLRLGEIALALDRAEDDPELAAAAQRLLDGQFLLERDDLDARRGDADDSAAQWWLRWRRRRTPS